MNKKALEARQIEFALATFERDVATLPGIAGPARRAALVAQMVDSARRVRYPATIATRTTSARFADPSDELFDPLRAAIVHARAGNIDEAFWLVFLFVHFGRNRRGGWRYAREIYGKLGQGLWDWSSVRADPAAFRDWLRTHRSTIERRNPPGGFGNHRKYESLDADGDRGTGAAVESYVAWVSPHGSHARLVSDALASAGGDARLAFDKLFRSMRVKSFGRMARFDYLAMVGRLRLAPIEPGAAYIRGSTGPLSGAKLLFGPGSTSTPRSPEELEHLIAELDRRLNVGMQAVEDALCNWQKSPDRYRRFSG